jgi:hypothetical protein
MHARRNQVFFLFMAKKKFAATAPGDVPYMYGEGSLPGRRECSISVHALYTHAKFSL